jgi:uncharacterized protein
MVCSIMTRAGRVPARLMAFLAVLSCTSSVWALDVPPLTGPVVDLAQVLPRDTAVSLATELRAHESKTSNQVAVLILPSLGGEPLEEYSHRVATRWKLGQKGTDNGVLLIVAIRDRKVRVEVGYGLEGALTDVRAARIIRDEIVPRFRAGDLPRGISAGVHAILGTIEGTYVAPETPPVRVRASSEPTALHFVVIGIIVGTLAGIVLSHGLHRTRALLGSVLAYFVAQFASVLFGLLAAGVTAVLLWLILLANRGGRGGRWSRDLTWGSGGSWSSRSLGGDVGFSGGGGDFGGGGASGNW